jgi:hypothetical protein
VTAWKLPPCCSEARVENHQPHRATTRHGERRHRRAPGLGHGGRLVASGRSTPVRDRNAAFGGSQRTPCQRQIRIVRREHDAGIDAPGLAVHAVPRVSEQDSTASSIETVSRTPNSCGRCWMGQPVVVYEVLCDNLHEDDIAVPRTLFLQLRDAASRSGADPERLAPLLLCRLNPQADPHTLGGGRRSARRFSGRLDLLASLGPEV